MCWLKTKERVLKIVIVGKIPRSFLDKDVLNKMLFSSEVGYLDGGIHCEGGMCPFFLRLESFSVP